MQAHTLSSQAQKAVWSERLASLSQEVSISQGQWKTSLDDIGRSRLQEKIDGLFEEMKKIENNLNQASVPSQGIWFSELSAALGQSAKSSGLSSLI